MTAQPVVFMVDDDYDVLKTNARILGLVGVRVLTHDAPSLLLTRLDEGEVPSLIITDMRMPGMCGDALAAAARQRGYTGPILLLSGTPPDETPPGVDRMLTKPVDIITFRAVVAEMLG